mgnify:CR=1 FL=1
MYINSAYLNNSKIDIKDKSKPLIVTSCGTYRLYNIPKLPTLRPRGRLDYQLIYVASGKAHFYFNEKEEIVTAGHMVLYRPKESQKYEYYLQDQAEVYWVHFTGSAVESMLSFFKERSYHIGDLPEFELFCSSLWSGSNGEEEAAELSLDGILITIIARIMKLVSQEENKNNELPKLHKALRVMKSECHIRRSNEELANLCGISKFYFMKLFKKNLGVSPQEYYARLIVDKSSYLLVDTNYSISEISKLCGIEDALYFSRMFKKHTGVSPNAYRKSKF